MTDDLVLRSFEGGVLTLTWNRPDRNNGWSFELEEAYFDALRAGSMDPDVRVIVVTGAGKTFCPGLDMNTLSAAAGAEGGQSITRRRSSRPHTYVRRIPKPVIAAINGACAGIGFVQAVACDLRFASREAKMTVAFPRRGLPAENSLSWMLERLVGAGTAADLLLSGRVVTGEEAERIGLVNRAYDSAELMSATMTYAKDMAANCSPRSLAVIKAQLAADWERPIEHSRQDSLALVSQMIGKPDFNEGVKSYVDRRPPRFAGLAHDPDSADPVRPA
jgi:enoyl-CoA hydratase/carnithine racemase